MTEHKTVTEAKLKNGDVLTLHVHHVQLKATRQGAFSALLGDGSVVTWDNANGGGDSSGVQKQLKNVQRIQAWVMDLWSPGAMPTRVATVAPSRSS